MTGTATNGHIRGRDRFRRHKSVINGICTAIRWLPRPLRGFIWAVTDIMHGTLGLVLRYAVLKSLAKACGENVYVGPNVEIRAWQGLSVGSNVSIHRGCYLDATGEITIGSDVSIAHHSSILSSEHTWEDSTIPIRDNPIRTERVVISDDVWIGCGTRVLAGVTIGHRSIVAAGAVLTHPVPSGVIVAGVPARTIRLLEVRESSESPLRP